MSLRAKRGNLPENVPDTGTAPPEQANRRRASISQRVPIRKVN